MRWAIKKRKLNKSEAFSHNSSSNGFITLEALVAFVILTFALVAFYQTIGGNFKTAGRINIQEIALAEAKSHLQSIGVVTAVVEGHTNGVYPSGVEWEMQASNLPAPKRFDGKDAVARYWVQLSVTSRQGKYLTELETVIFAHQ